MLWTYRSPLIAALMLVRGRGRLRDRHGDRLRARAGRRDDGQSGQSTAILIVLMFGAGTDYCLLIVSRFREEGDVASAMRGAAPAIFASGGIVVASMLVLALADFNATREMGPILALGIAVMIACGLTLLPALLTFTKPAAAGAERLVGADRRARPAPAGAARRRCALGLLVLGALGNLSGRGYLDLAEQYRDKPESVLGQELIARALRPAGPGRAGRRGGRLQRRARGQGRARAGAVRGDARTRTPTAARWSRSRCCSRSTRSRPTRWTGSRRCARWRAGGGERAGGAGRRRDRAEPRQP